MKAAALVAGATVALGMGAPPSRVQVVAHEFAFSLSRTQLKRGPAVIQLANFGQDAHDLRIQRVGARHVAGTRVVQAGEQRELTANLVPGRYLVWCSVANHRALGMRAVLVVTS